MVDSDLDGKGSVQIVASGLGALKITRTGLPYTRLVYFTNPSAQSSFRQALEEINESKVLKEEGVQISFRTLSGEGSIPIRGVKPDETALALVGIRPKKGSNILALWPGGMECQVSGGYWRIGYGLS